MPKKARGYAKPERLPAGTKIESGSGSERRRWCLGPPVGAGGFGDIYSARDDAGSIKGVYPYVVKIEPHENGPLFVEMHFYMRNARKSEIDNFTKTHKLEYLGMPVYVASGSHEHNGKRYRFIVLERYGEDLWRKFIANNRSLPVLVVLETAVQMLDVYEYIHGKGYVHADLKGANILFGRTSGTENQAYLLDFGLASHYTNKEFKRDPKKAHNGTIEYTSRDAHNGVPTMRGDMEILGYNIIQWLCGSLPWEKDLKNPTQVQSEKEKYMNDIPGFLNKCFKTKPPPAVLSYLQYVSKMNYDETPNYKKCRQMFLSNIKSFGDSPPSLDIPSTSARKKTSLNITLDSNEIHDSPEEKKSTRKRKLGSKETMEKKNKKTNFSPKKNSDNSSINVGTPKTQTPNAISRVLRSNLSNNHNDTVSSIDIFEDSCVETPPKKGLKKKHVKKIAIEYCTDEEVTVQTTVKKKDGIIKKETRSWRKCPTILNSKPVVVNTTNDSD